MSQAQQAPSPAEQLLLNMARTLQQLVQQSHQFNATPQPTPRQDQVSHRAASLDIKAPFYFGKANESLTKWAGLMKLALEAKQVPADLHVLQAANHLKDDALQWYLSYQARSSSDDKTAPALHSLDDLVSALNDAFIPPQQQMLLRDSLSRLSQTRSVQEYVTEFRNLTSMIVGMSEPDLLYSFIEGLKPTTRAELRYKNPKTLEEAINIAHVYDSAHYTQRRPPSNNRQPSSSYATAARQTHFHQFHPSTRPPRPLAAFPQPMEIDNIRQNTSQKNFKNTFHSKNISANPSKPVCFSCNKPGHIARHCPDRRQTSSYNAHVNQIQTVIQSAAPFVNSLLYLDGSIENKSCRVLLDSGSLKNYVSRRFVDIHSLPHKFTGERVSIKLADGATSEHDRTVATVKLRLGELENEMLLDVFESSSDWDVILGRQWFFINNPSVDWQTSTVTVNQTQLPTLTTPPHNEEDIADIVDARVFHKMIQKEQPDLIYVVTTSPTEKSQINPIHPALQRLLQSFQDLFPDDLPDGLPPSRVVELEIPLMPDATPAFRPIYRTTPQEDLVLNSEIERLLKKGFIQKSTSPWAAAVVFAGKKDGSIRVCFDYRALNERTVKNRYPLPRIDEILDDIAGKAVFSTLDLLSGYHQLRVKEEDITKTAFRCRQGHFEWLVAPFGVTTVPPTFSQLMNQILAPFLRRFVVVYLDDILIYSNDMEEHQEHLRQVFNVLRENQLYCKMSKCVFGQPEVTYLGFRVGVFGKKPDPEKTVVLQKWPRPTTKTELRSFLGLINFYSNFIPSKAALLNPLTSLLKQERAFSWSPAAEVAFLSVKDALSNSPVLITPHMDKAFTLHTDASDFAIGAVLSQDLGKGLQPVAFISRKLQQAEVNYPVHEKELLAIRWSLERFRHYLQGAPHKTIVYTDHASLAALLKRSDQSRRVTRWTEYLQRFDFELRYRPGTTNTAADALSRVAINVIEESDWPSVYVQYLHDHTFPDDATAQIKKLVASNSHLFDLDEEGTLWRKDGDKLVLYVPFSQRADTVYKMHHQLGHIGIDATLNALQARIWFPRMKTFIRDCLRFCPQCQVNSNQDHTPHEPQHALPTVPPFHRWHLDFIGILPATRDGNRWIITAVDATTKWPVARALPEATSDQVSKFIHEEIVMRFGCPVEIITDRGANLRAMDVEAYLQRMHINHFCTSAYHPRSNGAVENFNGVLGGMLTKFCNGAVHKWDRFLNAALFACRVRLHHATRRSPFFLTYGVEPKIPGDILEPKIFDLKDPEDIVAFRIQELEALGHHRQAAEAHQQRQNTLNQTRFDSKVVASPFLPGDRVLLRNMKTRKFEPKWSGPFFIKYVAPFGTYKLITTDGLEKDDLVHRDRLKPAAVAATDNSRAWYISLRNLQPDEPEDLVGESATDATTTSVADANATSHEATPHEDVLVPDSIPAPSPRSSVIIRPRHGIQVS